MSRQCSVCAHPDAVLINEALVLEKKSNRAITRQFELSKDAVRRHREHIPELLAKASRAIEAAEADDLLSRLEALQSRTLAVLEAVEGTENYGVALAAIREARSNLELIGRVTKELESAPTLNFHLNPQWLELRALIVCAVEPFPDARASILRALEGASNGSA